jgi:hypothetical protein
MIRARRLGVALPALLILFACTSEPRSSTYPTSPPSASTIGVSPATGTPTIKPIRVRLPDVTIQKLTNARQRLRARGFTVLVKPAHGCGLFALCDLLDSGTVVKEWPHDDSVREGRRITLFVYQAPQTGPCTPGYSPCLLLGPSDYNCYGGGAGGPYTEAGVTYRVTGYDPYGLDGDNDGFGCE